MPDEKKITWLGASEPASVFTMFRRWFSVSRARQARSSASAPALTRPDTWPRACRTFARSPPSGTPAVSLGAVDNPT